MLPYEIWSFYRSNRVGISRGPKMWVRWVASPSWDGGVTSDLSTQQTTICPQRRYMTCPLIAEKWPCGATATGPALTTDATTDWLQARSPHFPLFVWPGAILPHRGTSSHGRNWLAIYQLRTQSASTNVLVVPHTRRSPTEFYFWWRLPRVDRSEVPTLGRAIAEIVFQRVRFGANLRHEATADRRRNSCCNSFHNAADSDLRSRRDSYGYSMFIKFDQLSPQPVVAKTAAPTIDSESWVDFGAARRRYTQYSEAADTRRCGIPPHFTKFRSADRNK